MKKHFTIGMAGHIDHGKTSLTKALTNVDTDRLKEEKERQISIEPGFAPLYENEEMQVSVIDVPGHERFIRQMIAGVAGIDLVVLVVAADEGVMPQTKEHLQILDFLGIKKGIVAISKIDKVEADFLALVKEEIMLELEDSIFKMAPVVMVDSLSQKGIDEVRELILSELAGLESRDTKGPFRLPIDQVFTVKGQGTVVRGTVYEGSVEEGKSLLILPHHIETKARQLQVHHKPAKQAFAGQRAALNLSSVAKEEIQRGDVLVSSEHFNVTKCLDVSLRITGDLEHMVKQRMPIKCHIGTSEVMGRIVFFDRNEISSVTGEILCQLRLEEEIVTKRGDRFILRRPSPPETIGGGWVIDPQGDKYRFGMKTIEELARKKEGKPEERIISAMVESKGLSITELMTRTSLDEAEIIQVLDQPEFVSYARDQYTTGREIESLTEGMYDRLSEYQLANPMRKGINKAEIIQGLHAVFPKALLEFVLRLGEEKGTWKRNGQFFATADFTPSVPKNWSKRVEGMLQAIKQDRLQVRYLENYLHDAGIPETIRPELTYFLVEQKLLMPLDDRFYLSADMFSEAVDNLKEHTEGSFEVSDAKAVLGLSRKYMIPFLERLDMEKVTRREGNKRIWL
ncbi:selenocysteine-specific translation elongation factor [Peribacillus cavernae]|uniref:Selenocysteine-specific elongation factor n=1 Tax=Peribacillus cavernae TaxID=1674310 RepID=A0A433HIS9_9BACI|nr:selenocysteine-specific translation elongation factor [Peribacillus cavernae]MDQ0220504.1 selenocysteine-specific elongation factor [Peribacillus cavernae]RUQ28002.1 selenocysteine-specific translation elongation factor [Peribacillus cavernae]